MSDAPTEADPARRLLFETDWLASEPYFYNVRTGRASADVHEVIDYAELDFDPQGFNDYLEFGFCAAERTPVREVKYVRFSTRLYREADGKLSVEYLPDPLPPLLGAETREDDVLELLHARVRAWEETTSGEIVVPTSGGFDSRLLDLLLKDRSRIRAFTYGVSDDQSRCEEVVRAQRLAQILGLRWERIEIGDFHRYFDEWERLYGPYVHAHGMYQLEFYHRILERVPVGTPVASGCTADAFAGSDDQKLALKPGEPVPILLRNGTRWGMHADSSQSRLHCDRNGWDELWGGRPELAEDLRLRVLEQQRAYFVLLGYLLRVPRSLGLEAWTPFTDLDVAAAMLMLPYERRRERVWLRDFFRRQGVDLEAEGFPETTNTLNLQAIRRVPLRPLAVDLLSEVVKSDYVRWINRTVGRLGLPAEWYWRAGNVKGFRRAVAQAQRWGIRERRREAYVAYLVLKPIEQLLRRRDAARRERG